MTNAAKRVLVVEDNAALASVVRFNLERAGLSVEVARNGREGWDRLAEGQFDLVVADHQMPEMTGVDLCRRMRSDPRLAELPVVMLTAKKLELDVAQLRDELGILDVVAKPFSPRELTRAIQHCLSVGAMPP